MPNSSSGSCHMETYVHEEDNPGPKSIKGDNSRVIIICAGQGYMSIVI